MPEALKRKPSKTTSNLAVTVPTPRVKVKAPDVSVDGLTVKVDGLTVAIDSAAFAGAINALAQQIAQLGDLVLGTMTKHDQRLIDHANRMETALAALAELPAPVVNMPATKGRASAGGWDVALVRDEVDNEILGFRLRPISNG